MKPLYNSLIRYEWAWSQEKSYYMIMWHTPCSVPNNRHPKPRIIPKSCQYSQYSVNGCQGAKLTCVAPNGDWTKWFLENPLSQKNCKCTAQTQHSPLCVHSAKLLHETKYKQRPHIQSVQTTNQIKLQICANFKSVQTYKSVNNEGYLPEQRLIHAAENACIWLHNEHTLQAQSNQCVLLWISFSKYWIL